MKSYGVTIGFSSTFTAHGTKFVLYVALTFQSVDEILRYNHSNATSSAVLSHGTTCFVCGSTFVLSLWMKSYGVTFQIKPLQQYVHVVLFDLYVVLTFESVDELLWCYHSNETYSAVLSLGTIYSVCGSNF